MGTNGSTMLAPLRQGLPPIDPARVSSSASCSLPARFEAVRGARKFTKVTLGDWSLGDRFDDVALVVSELVTNALRHALPEESAHEIPDPPVRLHLMRWPGKLVCAVRDPSPESPGPFDGDGDGHGHVDESPFPDPTGTAESGRGLFLVDSFSDSWGWHPLAGALHGKVVWALFRLS
ncbi:ATP-binding protein [Streptomyces jumonjinensis]|uniref:ATP-binding protein n=1 Tax=Streptomyces jumonjinensis TaxID=1945 RepID=A0A646KRA9_STRJU|nr:ATP-binding protein [Streptomyces jumonjinensis]MQT03546.1 ATP-binding protein [Streptomyces jumonjinensis]